MVPTYIICFLPARAPRAPPPGAASRLIRMPAAEAEGINNIMVSSSSLHNATDDEVPREDLPHRSWPQTEITKSKRIVTLALLRKRSEHNEGLVSSLEELALHQEELQSIGPVLGRTCGKTLKILLLQNNVIERMVPSELKLFRSLEYLNLALNNITKVEGIGRMEWLRKLDLTLNFIDVDSLEESADELGECRSLEELYFLGNPCMGISNDGDVTPSPSRDQIGWKGCRAYIVARLTNLKYLDGKEIKRSERILATQQLSTLTSDLRSLAQSREMDRRIHNRGKELNSGGENHDGYISDDAPTYHNPETRTKISNESYQQKHAKEKQETANQAPVLQGEKEWEEDHLSTVTKVRKCEERDREWESSNLERTRHRQDDDVTRRNGGIKQCNQGKYQFWFEEEHATNKTSGNLIMRVATPKYLSTSLIDVDIHPTYVSVITKSKVLRVVLPVEVLPDRSVARRIAASGCLELLMPKVHPDHIAIGLEHGGDLNGRNRHATTKISGNHAGSVVSTSINKNESHQKRERLGESLMKAAGVVDSLKFVRSQCPDAKAAPICHDNGNDDDDEDEPPPLI